MTTCQSILFTDDKITSTCQNFVVPAEGVVRSVISIIIKWSCNPAALINKMAESTLHESLCQGFSSPKDFASWNFGFARPDCLAVQTVRH